MPIDEHEVYPHAPLAFVTVEIRFPGESGQGITSALQRAFRDVLGEEWVTEQLTQQEVTFGMTMGSPAQAFRAASFPRFTVRDRTSAVVLTTDTVTLQTTRYRHWADFRSVLERVITATAELVAPEGVSRVGMRFVDEIRVPSGVGEHLEEWAQWLSADVLAPVIHPMSEAGWLPTDWTSVVQYRLGDGKQVVFRYGPQQGPYAVAPDGPLRRIDPPPPGPLFLLDFDSFWEPPTIPRFEVDELLSVCDTLREPTRVLFDNVVTERLVDEVFRVQRNDS